MKKILLLLLFLVPFAVRAQELPDAPVAKVNADVQTYESSSRMPMPQPVERHDKVNLVGRITLYGAAVLSSIESDRQTDLCRDRVGVARCQGGYGEVTVRQSLNGVITAGAILMSELAHHWHWKEWPLPVVAVTTYNGITAYQQSQIHGTKDPSEQASLPRPKVPIAICGSPECAGCYDIGEGKKIHPPRGRLL